MKKTLLSLMLVSSLFVISCGADATKPGDLQATSYESKTGTATYTGKATASQEITASTIYTGLNAKTGDSVKITKIVSVKSQDTATGQYTTDVTFTPTINAAGDIVLSVTPTTAGLNNSMVEIAYQYKVDTVPSSQGTVDVSKIKPTLEAEVVYNKATHSPNGITVDNPALSAGKKAVYKLYSKNTTKEPTVTDATSSMKDGTITILSTELTSLVNNDKVYYKIWVY